MYRTQCSVYKRRSGDHRQIADWRNDSVAGGEIDDDVENRDEDFYGDEHDHWGWLVLCRLWSEESPSLMVGRDNVPTHSNFSPCL